MYGKVFMRPVVAQGTVKSFGWEFDPHARRWNIYLLKLIFPCLRSGVEVKRWVLPLNTQCLQNSAESEERTVLTLGSLCLPFCVRDTAWCWFIYFILFMWSCRGAMAQSLTINAVVGSNLSTGNELFSNNKTKHSDNTLLLSLFPLPTTRGYRS